MVYIFEVLLEFQFPSVSAKTFDKIERTAELCHIPVIPNVKSTVKFNRAHL